MTVVQTDKVDFISTDKETGQVKLTISDHLDWSNTQEHLEILQNKLNAYVVFIESGEIKDKYNDYTGVEDLAIQIAFEHTPNDKAREFLNNVENVLNGIDVSLVFMKLNS